jgi:hypothetical protein
MLDHPVYVRMPTENDAPLFASPSSAEAVITALVNAQRVDWLRMHAFVLLPDALEMVCTPLKQGISGVVAHIQADTIPTLMVLLPHGGMVWGRKFAHMGLSSRHAFEARLSMLLLAPVAAGLVESASEYVYSSANSRYNSAVSQYAGFMKTGMLTPFDAKPIISELSPEGVEKVEKALLEKPAEKPADKPVAVAVPAVESPKAETAPVEMAAAPINGTGHKVEPIDP